MNGQSHSGIAHFYKDKILAREIKKIANIITACRILLSVLLLFFPAFSPMFYVIYCAAGLTDMLDGFVARKTNTVSEFGSKLDTVADFVFLAVCMGKLLPAIKIPGWLWGWIGIIAVIKLVNIISGYVLHKELAAEHTMSNKITGILLFLLPLTLELIDLRYSGGIVCAVATFAAIQEGHRIRTKD